MKLFYFTWSNFVNVVWRTMYLCVCHVHAFHIKIERRYSLSYPYCFLSSLVWVRFGGEMNEQKNVLIENFADMCGNCMTWVEYLNILNVPTKLRLPHLIKIFRRLLLICPDRFLTAFSERLWRRLLVLRWWVLQPDTHLFCDFHTWIFCRKKSVSNG